MPRHGALWARRARDDDDGPRGVDTLRLQPELRATHIELLSELRPARVLYLRRNYDLADDAPAPPETHRVGAVGMLREVWFSRANRLEIWETLWMRHLPLHVALLAVWWARSLVHGRRPVLMYAMENSTLRSLLGAGRNVPTWLEWAAARALGAVISQGVTRIVFASDGSRRTYQGLPWVAGVPSSVVTDLPVACAECTTGDGNLVFVGRLAEHKGVRDAMRAWEHVEQVPALEGRRFVLVGDGPLGGEVREWAAARPASREALGALQHSSAVDAVERATALVLVSRRRRRWREQIGLPIREALAHGLTVVAASETGLSDWLTEHGHYVVRPGEPADVAAALVGALTQPLPRRVVRASLPAVDARVLANRALHADL